MASRTGSATLPLHGGYVPAWLYQRMPNLGSEERLMAIRRLDESQRGLDRQLKEQGFKEKRHIHFDERGLLSYAFRS